MDRTLFALCLLACGASAKVALTATPPDAAPYSPDYDVPLSWPPPPHPQGIAVQSGYEGYLVPAGSETTQSFLGPLALAVGSLLTPFPALALRIGLKLGLWGLGLLGLFAVGAVFTSAVCTFTPLCTISFLGFRFNQESVRSFITEDRLQRATKFVMDAVEKYKNLNQKKKSSISEVKSNKLR